MFSQLGFFGTRAPMYLDIVGVYFGLLPLLMFISIRFAVKGEIKKHYVSQLAIFIGTLVMVVVFEVGMRLAGGYAEYIKDSSISHSYFITFLIIHIIVAVLTVNLWSYQIISSMKMYKNDELKGDNLVRHKKLAKILLIGLFVTLVQGTSIYYFLFVM